MGPHLNPFIFKAKTLTSDKTIDPLELADFTFSQTRMYMLPRCGPCLKNNTTAGTSSERSLPVHNRPRWKHTSSGTFTIGRPIKSAHYKPAGVLTLMSVNYDNYGMAQYN